MFARARELAGFIAPTTVITALLLYFGAVYTDGRLAYYGIQLGLADLANQDLLIYGSEAVYAPVAFILVAILVALAAHAGIGWLLVAPRRRGASLAAAATFALVGILAMARATIGIFVPAVAKAETPGLTPAALAAGPALLAYGVWIAGRVLADRPASPFQRWYAGEQMRRVRRACIVVVSVLVLTGLFWATNRFAFALGLNRSYEDAVDTEAAYRVVLDTREPLVDPPGGVTETRLSTEPERAYQYRYHGLRLVLESGGRLFLVPEQWSREGRTLVIPYNDSIRIQLIPPPKNLSPQ